LNKKLIAPIILGVAVAIMLVIPISSPTQLQCSNDKGECYETTLLRVIDGDTVKDSNDQSIRFSLVSAPELDEKGGDDSKVFLEAICPVGSKITVDEDDGQLQGSYDRTIAQVYCNGMSMNAEMIYNNHATIDVRFCGTSEFTFELWAESCGMEHDKFLD
jgi:micrococcal nuclease